MQGYFLGNWMKFPAGERIYDGGKLTIEKSDVYMAQRCGIDKREPYIMLCTFSNNYYAGKHGLSKEISKDAWSF